MINKQYSAFWWEDITGPQKMVDSAVNAMVQRQVPVLISPSPFPYRDGLALAIQEKLKMQTLNNEIVLRELDASSYDGRGSAEVFCLKKLASPTVYNQYRSSKNMQDFFTEQKVTTQKLIWIRQVPTKFTEEWLSFLRKLTPEFLAENFFVLELLQKKSIYAAQRIQPISFQNSVSLYDVQLFSQVILGQKEKNGLLSRYCSALASNLCRNDGEFASFLLHNEDFITEDPYTFLELAIPRMTSMEEATDYSEDHLVSMVYQKDQKSIKKRVWQAQLEAFFPLLELRRMDIVEEYWDDLEQMLQQEVISQFNQKVTDPLELEIGTLYYNRRFLPHLADEIVFLRDCRNKIAHGDCCTPEEIENLFQRYDVPEITVY